MAKRTFLNSLLTAGLVLAISFGAAMSAAPTVSNAKVVELKDAGVRMDRGKWIQFHTYLPYQKKNGSIALYDQKLSCKITKYRDEKYSDTDASGRIYRTNGEERRKITLTIHVQLPTDNSNEVAGGIERKDYFTEKKAYNVASLLYKRGNSISDYFDVLLTDYVTGENLLINRTDAGKGQTGWTSGNSTGIGSNYQDVIVLDISKWTPVENTQVVLPLNYRDPTVTGVGTKLTYYQEYFASLTFTAPVSYKNACIGIAGVKREASLRSGKLGVASGIMWYNQSYRDGFATFKNTAHWDKSDKTLAHFIKIKAKKNDKIVTN